MFTVIMRLFVETIIQAPVRVSKIVACQMCSEKHTESLWLYITLCKPVNKGCMETKLIMCK